MRVFRVAVVALAAAAVVALAPGTSADADPGTSGNAGVGNGTQVVAPVQVPVNVCGNAIAVVGAAAARCQGGGRAGTPRPCPTLTGAANIVEGRRRCATSSPTPSGTPTGGPSATPSGSSTSPAPSGTPGSATPTPWLTPGPDELPETGSPVGRIVGLGGSVLVVGFGLVLWGRRRRSVFRA